jgi:hypothetical protein
MSRNRSGGRRDNKKALPKCVRLSALARLAQPPGSHAGAIRCSIVADLLASGLPQMRCLIPVHLCNFHINFEKNTLNCGMANYLLDFYSTIGTLFQSRRIVATDDSGAKQKALTWAIETKAYSYKITLLRKSDNFIIYGSAPVPPRFYH